MISGSSFICAGIFFVQLIHVSDNSCGWTNNGFAIDTDFNDVYINKGILDDLTSIPSVIVCQKLCLSNPECVSFFTNKPNRTCRLLGVKFVKSFVNAGQYIDDVGSRYFNLEEPTGLCTNYIWDRVDNKCYWFYTSITPRDQARSTCIGLGERFIIPDTAAFNNRLKRQILSSAEIDKAGYWIGGSDEVTEGIWKWDDGTSVDYGNWRATYPRSVNSETNYLVMIKDGGLWTWMDVRPVDNRRYICERTIQ